MEVDLQRRFQTAWRVCYLLRRRCLTLQRRLQSRKKTCSALEFKTQRNVTEQACHTRQERCLAKTHLIKTIGGAKSKHKTGLESQCFMTHAQRGHHSAGSRAAGEARPSIPHHLPMTSIDKNSSQRGLKVVLTPAHWHSAHCVTWESAVNDA